MATGQTANGSVILPPGVVLTSRASRLLCAMLEVVLAIVTLGIGYIIWSLFTFRHGQTPGKRLLGIRVVSLNDGKAVGFWMMVLREWIVEEFIASITFGIAYIWILFDHRNQSLYDKVLNTIVVDDTHGLTLPDRSPGATATTF